MIAPVGDDGLGLDALILQQPPQKSKCSFSIALLPHDNVHYLPFAINGAPDSHALANRKTKMAPPQSV